MLSVPAVEEPWSELTTVRNSSAPRSEKEGSWWMCELDLEAVNGEPETDDPREDDRSCWSGIRNDGRARVPVAEYGASRSPGAAGLESALVRTVGVGNEG